VLTTEAIIPCETTKILMTAGKDQDARTGWNGRTATQNPKGAYQGDPTAFHGTFPDAGVGVTLSQGLSQ